MKHIFLNLKRFDVPVCYGGVNRIATMQNWGRFIVEHTQDTLKRYDPAQVEFVQFFPEAHLLGAIAACGEDSPVKIGCQGVYRMNTSFGGNFGAFTSNRPASAMVACGVKSTIIGHCEERDDKAGILAATGASDTKAVNRILNQEIRQALESGMNVLYCVGEKATEVDRWEEVLGEQLEIGLKDADRSRVVVAYEPVWSIGPGKKPADAEYIAKIARFIKKSTGGVDVVYGGGLKMDNAKMLAGIPEIDGGLIALTRFQGEIGFYPEEYLEIVRSYLEKRRNCNEA